MSKAKGEYSNELVLENHFTIIDLLLCELFYINYRFYFNILFYFSDNL